MIRFFLLGFNYSKKKDYNIVMLNDDYFFIESIIYIQGGNI